MSRRRGELMVHREMMMDDVAILTFSVLDGELLISYQAARAQWFAPEEPGADPDGWMRDITQITGTLHMSFADPAAHEKAVATLQAWAQQGTLVRGFTSLQQQAFGLVDPVSRQVVAVKMAPEDLDRV